MPILNLKKWRENERFTARDYMYERTSIVNTINQLETVVETAYTESTKVILSINEPDVEMDVGDIWLDS